MITRECDRCGGEAHPDDVPVCGDCRASKLRVERQRTDAAQAEVARRGDVMLAALREIERTDYNAAARLLAEVVRP